MNQSIPVSEVEPKSSFFERVWMRIQAVRSAWASSMRIRIITLIVVGVTVGAGMIGVVITTQIRTAVFQQAVQSNVEQFTSKARTAQKNFSDGASYTAGQIQQIANTLVASMSDPARGLMGALLMRSAGQETFPSQIVEPSTASVATLRTLISSDLRTAVAESSDVAWQSVGVPLDPQDPESATYPGIVVGVSINIPAVGQYEFYALYSLQSQEQILDSTYSVLTFGIVALIVMIVLLIIVMLHLVLKPVQAAAAGAQQIGEGDLRTRMKVEGTDELAQLARSFNSMAASLEEQFSRLERMSELQTAFVSAVSHELRSPVTTIRMAGQLIYDKREELSPSLKRSVELQHDQLVNLDSMLSDLLEISRYDAGAMNLAVESSDIAELVKKVIEMVQPLANDNGVQIQLMISADATVEGEPRRIERIIRNLVVNAVEHGESKPVQVRVVGNDTAVAVEVTDHGVGLTPEQASHVFDRFWRADTSRVRKTGGTGLGLTIAREDALIHGGTLDVTGELGVGSRFLLVIPRRPRAAYTAPIKMENVSVPTDLLETPCVDDGVDQERSTVRGGA